MGSYFKKCTGKYAALLDSTLLHEDVWEMKVRSISQLIANGDSRMRSLVRLRPESF